MLLFVLRQPCGVFKRMNLFLEKLKSYCLGLSNSVKYTLVKSKTPSQASSKTVNESLVQEL